MTEIANSNSSKLNANIYRKMGSFFRLIVKRSIICKEKVVITTIDEITPLCQNIEKQLRRRLNKERESYSQSLQLTIQHELLTRIKTCMMILNTMSIKIHSIKDPRVNHALNSANLAKIELSQIMNYAENVYNLHQIKTMKYAKVFENFYPEVAVIEVLEHF